MSTPGVVFDGVTKVYSDGTVAVRDFSLTVDRGELVVLMGPSGCGKTTSLRMVAGLETITSGHIEIDGRRVDHLEPKERDVAMVFQSYALYPHKTAFENIAFPLRLRHVSRAEIVKRVNSTAGLLGITDLLKKKPKRLSGGQQQRVAMGRAIVRNPAVFLLDEPLSNLDAKLRTDMRSEIARLHQELGVTTLYVTHDQIEAMTLGDRVAVFNAGRLQQVGTPQELYSHPANAFVASSVGSPPMNLARASVHRQAGGETRLMIGSSSVTLDGDEMTRHGAAPLHDRLEAIVGVRPESLSLGTGREGRQIAGKVVLVEDLGHELVVHVEVDARPAPQVAAGDDPSSQSRFRLKATAAERPQLRTEVKLTIRDGGLFMFDLATGDAIGINTPRPVQISAGRAAS